MTAACCWHWFDRSKASAEVLRLLKPGGWLVICAQNWYPLGDNVVARTEAIVQRHNPKWPFGGLDGMTPGAVRDLRAAGFRSIESVSVDFDIPYSHEGWRGRVRASAGVSGSLPPEQVQAFDGELAAMLARDFPRQPMGVTHCLHAAFGRKDQASRSRGAGAGFATGPEAQSSSVTLGFPVGPSALPGSQRR